MIYAVPPVLTLLDTVSLVAISVLVAGIGFVLIKENEELNLSDIFNSLKN